MIDGSPEAHGALQQAHVNPPQAANPNRQRHTLGNLSYGRVVIEQRHQRTQASKRQSENRADAQINPKKIARERMRKLLALHDQFCESIQTEAAKQEAKSRDHGHNPEISRGKEPREDNH